MIYQKQSKYRTNSSLDITTHLEIMKFALLQTPTLNLDLSLSKLLYRKCAGRYLQQSNTQMIVNIQPILCQIKIRKKNIYMYKRYCPNVSTTPLQKWGFWQCLPFSWATLRGKHCRHPIAVMGVVDTFGLWKVEVLLRR